MPQNDFLYAQVRECRNHVITLLAETKLNCNGRIYLTVTTNKQGYHFYYGYDDQTMIPVYLHGNPEILSSITNEGFTGTYLGMYATSNGQTSDNFADFDWVIYEGLSE